MSDNDFFIGWAPTPDRDRRFLVGAALGLMAGAATTAALAAIAHKTAGEGRWAQSQLKTFTGNLMRAPWPSLLTADAGAEPRMLLLGGYGKSGVDARIQHVAGRVRVRGSLIERGANAMIAMPDDPDALVMLGGLDEAPPVFREVDEGPAVMTGEILDAKCWFGAMRPGEGKVHKSCAALCIRGGLPIVFCGADCSVDRTAPLFVNQNGLRHDESLLPYAADPVLASGRIVRVGGVRQFRVALRDISRL